MILVPRAAPHLPRTLAFLRKNGFEDCLGLEISHPRFFSDYSIPPATTALILTSALAINPHLPRLPCYCVGHQTAESAESAGFPVAYVGSNNAESLALNILEKNLPPQTFLHIHGDQAKKNWYPLLESAGHRIDSLTVYSTLYAEKIPPGILTLLHQQPALFTLLFSPASANHLAKLLEKEKLPITGTALVASAQVARVTEEFWPRTIVSPSPSLEAMIAVLKGEILP